MASGNDKQEETRKMISKKLLKILNSHEWKEEESQCSIHVLDQFKTTYLETHRIYNKKLFSAVIYAVESSYAFEWAPLDDSRKVLEWVISIFKNNKKLIMNKYREFLKVCSDIRKLFAKIERGLDKYLNRELKDILFRIHNLSNEQYGYASIPEGADTITEDDYHRYLQNVDREAMPEVISVLSTPEELSFFEKEKIDLLKIALTKNQKGLDRHTKNYFWIHNNFNKAVYLDENYFLDSVRDLLNKKTKEQIREDLKSLQNKKKIIIQKRKEIYKKYKLSSEAKIFFEVIRFFSLIQDQRKENIQRLVYATDRVLNQVAKRFKIPKNTLYNYFVPEVSRVLDRGNKVSKKDFQARKKLVTFSYDDNGKIKTDYLMGKEAEEVVAFFRKKREKIASEGLIKGFVASVGKGEKTIKGVARIVLNPAGSDFKEGEILVAGMTRPEFVPLMKKAKAVITNEGGITTHAAIVSRELGVPCIIGTKIATDVLKSGDFVQLDLNKGIVKILKSKKL